MIGLAIIDFHWTGQQFWDATPHEWWAAWEVVKARAEAPRADR